MRFLVSVMMLAVAGCVQRKPEFQTLSPASPSSAITPAPALTPPSAPGTNASPQKLIVTPENVLVGKVATVNGSARFVVLTFPVGHLPAAEAQLNVYRRGLKVGEVKTTNMQLDDNIVADILEGDVESGDEVREK